MYSKIVASRVLKILEAGGQVSSEKILYAVDHVKGDISEALIYLIQEGLDENIIQIILERAYELQSLDLDPSKIPEEVLHLLPYKFIEQEGLIPFEKEENSLKVGVVDPTQVTLEGQIKAITNLNVTFFLIKKNIFEICMKHKNILKVIENSKSKTKKNMRSVAPMRRRVSTFDIEDSNLIISFCDDILQSAFYLGGSDIHIEAFRDTVRVRFRINGILEIQKHYTDYLQHNYVAIVTRLKILANCDIAEKRIPQDGSITFQSQENTTVDTRFSVLPGKYGERIVIRLLKNDSSLNIDNIGFSERDISRFTDAILAPQGMVLVTGPTGSGKTTTLYGALKYINTPSKNILTVEDPIEYYLEGVGQTQVNDKIGMTFDTILRAFLRQDPEVILVGEIRDQTTVEISVKASLTGHLLLSTLHTNNSVSTITRLCNMGIPRFMIAASLSLIVSQRLARKNCQSCLVTVPYTVDEVLRNMNFCDEEKENLILKKGAGCKKCGGTGYRGQQGIYEVLKITPEIEDVISSGHHDSEILEFAQQDGFLSMQETGKKYLVNGILSVEEYSRVLVT